MFQFNDDSTLFGVHVPVKFWFAETFYYTGTVYLSRDHAPEVNPKQQFPSPDGLVMTPRYAQGTFSNASGSGHAERIAARRRDQENQSGEPSNNDADAQDEETSALNPHLLNRDKQPVGPSSRVSNQKGTDLPSPDSTNVSRSKECLPFFASSLNFLPSFARLPWPSSTLKHFMSTLESRAGSSIYFPKWRSPTPPALDSWSKRYVLLFYLVIGLINDAL